MPKGLALVIEDDDSLVEIFSEALRRAGFQTEGIQSGILALERLQNSIPAVVLLDLHLPEISGTELLHYMRADQRFNTTRVIIATADAILGESLRDHADLVLIKPISFTQLRDLAARL